MKESVQESKESLQKSWSLQVEKAVQIASLVNAELTPEALAAVSGEVDMRPHFYDKKLKKNLLVDSGSAVTAWPPEPGDSVDPAMKLRAVNGTRLNCYGYKDVVIQMGRKQLKFKAIKTDVVNPILGWDFIKFHKLNFFWNKWGDMVMSHRKSGIKEVLAFKSLPDSSAGRLSSLKVFEPGASMSELPDRDPLESARLCEEVWAMEQLGFSDINQESNENEEIFKKMEDSE